MNYPVWELTHLCTDAKKLPSDLFVESAFGSSPANPSDDNEPSIATGLNIEAFRRLGFPKDYCRALDKGLPLLMHQTPPSCDLKNYNSVFENEEFARVTLDKWKQMGVYEVVQQKPHIVNPLGVVVHEGKQRMVLDATASGLNACLLAPRFKLPSHSHIINQMCHGDFMAKVDLKNGFLQLPVRYKERTFLGFRHPFTGELCQFVRLAFGLTSATFLFQTFSNGVKHFLRLIMQLYLEVYIDDIIMWGRKNSDVTKALYIVMQICAYLGITINHEKTEGPLQRLKFLGLIIDTLMNLLLLPEEKRQRYRGAILHLLSKDEQHSMDELACVAGRIVHSTAIHTAGWAHVQPLWDMLYHKKGAWTKRQLKKATLVVSPELEHCLTWWSMQFEHVMQRRIWHLPNNRLQLWDSNAALFDVANAITIMTDASSSGWGASLDTLTIEGVWTSHQQSLSNNWRETKAIILAVRRWSFVRDNRILVLTDNSTAVAVVNARNPAATGLQLLARELDQLETERGIQIVARHLPGALNGLPDELSRQKSTVLMPQIDCELPHLDQLGICPSITLGMRHGKTITRHTPMPCPRQDFLLMVTPPDLPFLKVHLVRWARQEPQREGWIATPAIPTRHWPLPGTQIFRFIGACMAEAPLTAWMLLRWSARELLSCSSVRHADGRTVA